MAGVQFIALPEPWGLNAQCGAWAYSPNVDEIKPDGTVLRAKSNSSQGVASSPAYRSTTPTIHSAYPRGTRLKPQADAAKVWKYILYGYSKDRDEGPKTKPLHSHHSTGKPNLIGKTHTKAAKENLQIPKELATCRRS